jgi:hypothetical protein
MNTGMNLCGGIGNMMFQIATAESLVRRFSDVDLYYPNREEQFKLLENNYAWTSHAREYLTIFKNFDWGQGRTFDNPNWNIKKMPFTYETIIPQDNDLYDGYFQSEKNFPNRDFVRHLFEPSDEVIDIVSHYDDFFSGYTTCSIHVRRGNYLDLQHIHPVQTMEYYNKAIECLKPFDIDKFIVFSDDLEWCADNFKGNKFFFSEEKDYIALILMTMTNHNIIANSSLSWFGAWLADQDNRVVIAPQNWFTNNTPNDKDIIPQTWIRY